MTEDMARRTVKDFIKVTEHAKRDEWLIEIRGKDYFFHKAAGSGKGPNAVVPGYVVIMGESGNPQRPIRVLKLPINNFFQLIVAGSWSGDNNVWLHPNDWEKLASLKRRSWRVVDGN